MLKMILVHLMPQLPEKFLHDNEDVPQKV